MKDLLTAFSFLTLLPVGRGFSTGEKELARSMAFYPLVGLVIGLLLALGYYLLSSVLPKPLAIWLTIGLLAFLTRGLRAGRIRRHGGRVGLRRNKQKILEVMRDSRIGAFGVISLILLVGASISPWIISQPVP